jgi:hypothetical protein
MDDIISPTERAYLLRHYRLGGMGPVSTVDYVITTAFEYADKNCPCAAPAVRNGIARVFINYTLLRDAGEKQLMRVALDNLIAIGKAHA